jgi:nitrite reductase/ring-hydroxylating ferredoxin subunit
MADAERLICSSADLADCGDGVRFEVEVGGKPQPAFAVRYGGRVYAYLNRCAHMPMELDWKPGKFFDVWGLHLICSTHGATYAPDTGRCVLGPCFEEGLVPVPVEERDGRVFVKGNPYGGRG